ncbi:MAG: ATP-dependent metallopeptidase FtsH/Yme1/Tma family protein, partial [Anaerotignaceae bacterium]
MPTGQMPGNGKQNDTKTLIRFMLIALMVTSVLNIFLASASTRTVTQIKYSDFTTMLEEGKVDYVEIEDDRLLITEVDDPNDTEVNIYKAAKRYYTGRIDDPELK